MCGAAERAVGLETQMPEKPRRTRLSKERMRRCKEAVQRRKPRGTPGFVGQEQEERPGGMAKVLRRNRVVQGQKTKGREGFRRQSHSQC